MMYKISIETTILGRCWLVEKDGFLVHLFLNCRQCPVEATEQQTPLLQEAVQQLQEYLSGKRKEFSLRLKPSGTVFQQQVWQQLQKIPYGQRCSYQDIAKALGNERAARAVGGANNKNSLPIFIPCHRVVGKTGDLVGFACGLDIKEKLLDLEAC